MAEEKFEKALIKKLVDTGWTYREDLSNKTDDVLWTHWREILNNNNFNRLNGEALSDTEFLRIETQINSLKTPYETQVILSGSGGISSISLIRDSGEQIELEIFYPDNVAGGKSIYEVVNQITFDKLSSSLAMNRRIDLLLLVNGIPVGHIEEKDELLQNQWNAFEQLKKYAGDGMYTGLMSFVQIQFIMSQHSANYLARPNELSDYNSDFVFGWRDSSNTDITNAFEFVNEVLNISVFHRLITVNIIPDNIDHKNMVMRSYQIQATRTILERLKQMSQNSKIEKEGGYIWHTTGSGKTITSFKVAQLIAMRPYIEDVLFVVDRVDLINQTFTNFKEYADQQFKSRINIRDGRSLKKRLLKQQSVSEISLITLQGLHKAVQSNLKSDKRLVIIMDEAHRSASGDSVVDIKKAFPNTTWFGFTGTPNFYSNEDEKIKTTKTISTYDVFGERLHQYTIKDAIGDNNVLGFNITYMDVDVLESNDIVDLRVPINDHDSNVYSSEVYQTEVVRDIGENWHKNETAFFTNKPISNYFSGMLAVSGKTDVISYYRLFKQMYPNLNVAMTFSRDDSNTENAVANSEALKQAILDYQDKFETINFLAQPNPAKSYIEDLTRRLSHKNPYQNPDENSRLDLVIVADQLLTGFDSKFVNMIYIDKMLQESGLIQAISRANRVLDMKIKPYAKVRFYRNSEKIKDEVTRALKIYTQGGQDTSAEVSDKDLEDAGVLARDVVDIIEDVNTKLAVLRSMAGHDFENVILSESDSFNFSTLAQKVLRDVNLILTQGYEFGEEAVHQVTGDTCVLDLSTKSDFGALTARFNDTIKNVPVDKSGQFVEYEVSLVEYDSEEINYDMLTNLVQDYQLDRKELNRKKVLDWVKGQSDLHRQFVDQLLSEIDRGIITEPLSFNDIQVKLKDLKNKLRDLKFEKFADKEQVDTDDIHQAYSLYIPGEMLVENKELNGLLEHMKVKYGFNMRQYKVFKQNLSLFMDKL